MNFSIDKKGYNTAEVDAYLKKLAEDYTRVVDGLRARVDELNRTVSEKEQRIATYKEKTGLVTKAILNAVSKADEIERKAKFKYDQEIARLKAFHEKWVDYYNRILEKYPIDEDLAALNAFNREMSRILAAEESTPETGFSPGLEEAYASEKLRTAGQRIGYITVETAGGDEPGEEEEYDPVARIRRYLSGEKNRTKDASVKKEKPAPEISFKTVPETLFARDQDDYADRSDSGFSFTEALNPKDDLEKIMKDLGLLLEDE